MSTRGGKHAPGGHADAISAIGSRGVSDINKLVAWIKQSHLDPNDPDNAELFQLVKSVEGSGSKQESQQSAAAAHKAAAALFRLDPLQQQHDFLSMPELLHSKRFRLLQLRQQEVPEMRNFKMVPCLEREIADSVFAGYDARVAVSERVRHGGPQQVGAPVTGGWEHRQQVGRFLRQVREQVMCRYRAAEQQLTLKDVVIEAHVPDISSIGLHFLQLTRRRHPLRPVRKDLKSITPDMVSGFERGVSILVNIERAYNVPVRKDPGGVDGGTAGGVVRPFVELSFQGGASERSSAAEGRNPCWNERLTVPFKAPNDDYSPSNLQTINDNIYINLFDEIEVDINDDDRSRDHVVHKRIEWKWLGSIKIPFTTVYVNSVVEGTLKVQSPRLLLGYTHSADPAQQGTIQGLTAPHSAPTPAQAATYLKIYVTIDPRLKTPKPMRERFDSAESPQLLDKADEWCSALQQRYPARHYRATVTDINGKTVFITRYFRALKPPEELLGDSNNGVDQSSRLAHYVSLIPFISDLAVFSGGAGSSAAGLACDIWSMSDQFLQMLAGDEEEHAVLLTNFMRYVRQQQSGRHTGSSGAVWLVLGDAIPEGATAYVMTREESGEILMWNASSGETYAVHDVYCPLKRVTLLVNEENIWANVQPTDDPRQMLFDLNNKSHWATFFNAANPHPGFTSLQPKSLRYVPTDPDYVKELQTSLEKAIRDKIMECRNHVKTFWNRQCNQAFRQILPRLEENRDRLLSEEDMPELKTLMSTYRINGYPMQMSYTDTEQVLERVISTRIHTVHANDIQFALAVYVHPYPNTVLSLWIYLATLTKK